SVGIADEDAWKIGAQYKFATKTTLNAIYEKMHRAAPTDTYNERSRDGYWLAATQKVTEQDDINVGWAHAAKSPGNPGSGALADPTAVNYGDSIDNASNMYAIGYKHHFADKQTTWYAVYAMQRNHDGAHYDLGASGHGITTDCHDAAGSCFAGNKIQGVSVGMTYNF
ncbi:MAG TPA: porin, partial [Burkholderiales bacterium]|nr:porin [Burkholderiales bacterium]